MVCTLKFDSIENRKALSRDVAQIISGTSQTEKDRASTKRAHSDHLEHAQSIIGTFTRYSYTVDSR